MSGPALHTDAHASQPFRRYYIGPSPVSSSAASKVARAIKDDVDVKQPVGWSVVGREGVTLVGGVAEREAAKSGGRFQDEPISPKSHQSSPAFVQSAPATKSTFASNDLSYSSARHGSANTTTDVQTSRRASTPPPQSSSSSQHPHRASTPPPKASSSDNHQLLSPPSARKKIELREIPSIHSLRGNESGQQPPQSAGLHARFIDSVDEDLIHHREERKNRTVSRDPSADEMIQVGLTPATTADDPTDRLSAGATSQSRDPTHDAFTTVSADGEATPRPFHRSMHTRDFSRQSRMSRASTAGTFGSAATKVTDGSFGATGGVRARLARAFPRRRKNKSRTSRSITTGGPIHHARLSANALAAAAAVNGDASAPHLDARHIRRSWKSGVAPGQVGTSLGGTKWVGQSFEVGARLKYVLEVCEQHRNQSAQQEQPTSPGGPPALPKIVTTSIDADANTNDIPSGSATSPRDRRQVNRSPSAVLSAFAKDATVAADDKRPVVGHTLPTIQSRGADDDASMRPLRGSPAANAKSLLAVPTNTPSPNRRTSFVIPSPKRAISIASLHPEEAADSQSPTAGAAPPIESRRGWSDIASLMSAQSSLQSSNLHRSIVDRAEQKVRAMRTGRKGLGGPAAERRENSDTVLAIPEAVETPGQTPGLVFKTPMETLSGSQDDYFAGGTTQDDNKSAPAVQQRSPPPPTVDDRPTPMMTAQEAFTHPDPPRAAEEKFPELTFNLLRRPSDVDHGRATGGQPPNNASDDAIASNVRPSTPPPRRQSHVTFNSPRYTIDSANGATTGPVTNVGSSLADSESPLLHNKPSVGSIVIHEQTQDTADAPLDASYLQRVPPTQPTKKKTVQFEKKNGTVSSRRGAPMRSLSTSLFPNSALSVPPSNELRPPGATFFRPSNNSSPSGDAAPAPPHIVLARPQPDDPSPGKEKTLEQENAPEEEFITRKSLLRRDRMLVKNDWTPSENVPQDLDEAQSRGLSIHPGQWREYIVVLRPGRIELWDDPGFADRFFSHTGQLHLAFVIPLSRGSTFLSVFSQVDRIFCLTYSQAHASTHVSGGGKQRKVLNLRKSGTNILLFEARTLTIGADWIWDIWREIGSNLPEAVEVHLPYAGLRVKFPIPEEMIECDDYEEEELAMIGGKSMLAVPSHRDQQAVAPAQSTRRDDDERGGEGYKMITRPRVVGTILRLLKTVPDYEQVLKSGFLQGLRFELAWRRGSTIEWVVYDRTMDDQVRYWSILFGSILKQTKEPSVLEFRKAQHYPTQVTLGDGQVLQEPPGLEGFLWRVRPVSGVLTRIYITTHDSHVFVCRPSRAYPPERYLAVDAEHIKALQASALQGPRDGGGGPDDGPNRSHTQPAKGRRSSVEGSARREMKRSATSGTGSRDESSASLLRRRGYMDAISHVSNDAEELAAQMEAYRGLEKQRQLDQIANADGYIEVKDIFLIRYLGDDGEAWKPGVHDPVRAPMPMPSPSSEKNENDGDNDNTAADDGETIDEDVIDIGGEEGLAHAAPATSTMGGTTSEHRMYLRRRRQFEVVMANGRTTRFEAYSKSVAKEWVHRIHDLATYWKRREKVDALEKMEVSGFDASLIRRNKTHDTTSTSSNSSPFDRMNMGGSEIDAASPALGNIWNWCTIMACRGIILCGRLFAKKRAYAPFYSRYYVLISGRLLSYKLVTSTRTARNRQNAGIFHKKTDTVIHLKDSYTWSGKLTEDMLRDNKSEGAGAASLGQFASGGVANTMSYGGRHKIPRVYADGMLSVDEDEDCTFVVRYRPQRVVGKGAVGKATTATSPKKKTQQQQQGPPQAQTRGIRRRSSMDTSGGVGGDDKTTIASASAPATATAIGTSTSSSKSIPVPPLNDSTYNLLVLRARSKLERDLWVRAIGHEKERVARQDVERELAMREKGQCPYKRHQKE